MKNSYTLLDGINRQALGNLSDAGYLALGVGLSESAPQTFSITEFCIKLSSFLQNCPDEQKMLNMCEDFAHVLKAFCDNADAEAPLVQLGNMSIADYFAGLREINSDLAFSEDREFTEFFDVGSEVVEAYGTENTVKYALGDIYLALFSANCDYKKTKVITDEAEWAMSLLNDLIIEPFATYATNF